MSSARTFSEDSLNETLQEHGVHVEGNRICWNKNARDHPRNWSPKTKYWTTIVICWLELYMTGISSAGVCCNTPLPLVITTDTIKVDLCCRFRQNRIWHFQNARVLRLRHHVPSWANSWWHLLQPYI